MLIDLVIVKYKSSGTELCIAPAYTVKPGDEVVTEWSQGTVVKTTTVLSENEIYKFLAECKTLAKVVSIITPVVYKDDPGS